MAGFDPKATCDELLTQGFGFNNIKKFDTLALSVIGGLAVLSGFIWFCFLKNRITR